MKEYYFVENEERKGPFSFEELKKKAISKDTLIWEDSFEDWKKASEVPEIAKIFKKSPPPIPQKKVPPPLPSTLKSPPPIPNSEQESDINTGINTPSKEILSRANKLESDKSAKPFIEAKSGNNILKNKWLYIIGSVILLFFIFSIFNEGNEKNEELSKSQCEELVDELGDFIVKKVFSGGTNIREKNKGCESVKNGDLIYLECNFNGNLNEHAKYYFYASVNLKHDGSFTVEFKNMDSSAKWWFYEIKGFANNKVEFDKNGVMLTQTKN